VTSGRCSPLSESISQIDWRPRSVMMSNVMRT
jgi:hypothetical protein